MSDQLLYLQIEQTIRERILNGSYPPGAKLPTEMELVREFGVSRLTIGKSLSQLVAEGLISRTRGRGSFVRKAENAEGEGRTASPGLIRYVSPVAGSGDDPSLRHGILEGIHDAVRAAGFSVGVEFFRDMAGELEILRNFSDPLNRAYVIWPSSDSAVCGELERLAEAKFPFVLVDAFFAGQKNDCVLTDNTFGAHMMIEHLAGLGHRRIAYLTVPLDRVSISERFAGAVAAAAERGIDLFAHVGVIPCPDRVVPQELRRPERDFVRGWIESEMRRADRPTAIFCSNDALALAVCEQLRGMRIAIPEEVSVAGFDDITQSEWPPVPLSTVKHDFAGIGRCAGEILLRRLRDGGTGTMPLQYRIAPELIVRASTAAPPGA